MTAAARTIIESDAAPAIDAAGFGSCPIPQGRYDHILLGHGSGGTLSNDLIRKLFVPGFGGAVLAGLEDQATVSLHMDEEKAKGKGQRAKGKAEDIALCQQLETGNQQLPPHPSALPRLAFTTDSFVVKPIFFPGGDIGRLAVHGTVNDLAVGGARPLFLSAAFILEEGLAIADLARIVASMRAACEEAGVTLVTGDTKVVDRGKGDQIFITTSGVGVVPAGRNLSIRHARPGDRIIVSGTIGDHGIAIMSVREGIEFETVLESDSAPLTDLVGVMLEACPSIRCMRDPTRGGVSSTLNELAEASGVGVRLTQAWLPMKREVKGACEMLGLDPLYVANEGKLIAVVPAEDADRVLGAMRGHALGRDAAVIGEVVAAHRGMVVMESLVGGERVVMMLTGEQLPRIC